jgi:hypothetical protein
MYLIIFKEVIGGIADILGIIGAILLAIPIFKSQRLKDTRDQLRQAAPGIRSQQAETLIGGIVKNINQVVTHLTEVDYKRAKWGIVLVIIGFGLKLIPFGISIDEAITGHSREAVH